MFAHLHHHFGPSYPHESLSGSLLRPRTTLPPAFSRLCDHFFTLDMHHRYSPVVDAAWLSWVVGPLLHLPSIPPPPLLLAQHSTPLLASKVHSSVHTGQDTGRQGQLRFLRNTFGCLCPGSWVSTERCHPPQRVAGRTHNVRVRVKCSQSCTFA